jgi:hypothetical protein
MSYGTTSAKARFCYLSAVCLAFLAGPGFVLADQKITLVQADATVLILADQPKTVTITATIGSRATLLPGSVSVGRYQSDGTLIATLATMHDDGLNGDVLAGDGIYTAQITINESAPTVFLWGVSATFTDQQAAVVAPGQVIFVQTGKTCEQALSDAADALAAGDSNAIGRLFSDDKNNDLLSTLDDVSRSRLVVMFRSAQLVNRQNSICVFRVPSFNPVQGSPGTVMLSKSWLGDWTVSSW